jgi:hypothetical protein
MVKGTWSVTHTVKLPTQDPFEAGPADQPSRDIVTITTQLA